MDTNRLIIVGLGLLAMYVMIFHNEKFNAANKSGWDNVDRTGKLLGKGAKAGWTIFKIFRR